MKKSLSLIKLTIITVIAIIPLFLMLKTVFPLIPHLEKKVICKKEKAELKILKVADGVIISCKDTISLPTLERAQTLEVKLTANEKFTLRVSLRYKHSETISTEILTVNPQTDQVSVITFSLDRPTTPKLNRLVSDIDEIVFLITDLKNPEELRVSLNEVYLN